MVAGGPDAPWLSKRELREAAPAWLRGTAIGLPFGVVPRRRVGDPDLPGVRAREASRRPPEGPQFGTGAIRGLAAPEAAGTLHDRHGDGVR